MRIHSYMTKTEPYILCLGTSNTYGNCKNGDELWLKEEQTVPGLLTKKLGIQCRNLGIGGVLMSQLTDVLIDALDEYDLSRCKGVLVEAQQGLNSSTHVSYDNFVDWKDNHRVKNTVMDKKDAIRKKDLKEVIDALTDILYVTYGAGHAFGVNLDKCFEEVQNSNMSKLGLDGKPIYNEKGKVMKGPKYFEPNLRKFIT